MSLDDPVQVVWNERRGMWYVKRGNETFYDERTRVWHEFDTEEEALEWARKNISNFRTLSERMEG